MSVKFNSIEYFDDTNEEYINIIKEDTRYYKTCRGKINYNYVMLALQKFTTGFIHISRHNTEESFSDDSKDEKMKRINKRKYVVNGFILFTKDQNEIYINIICVSDYFNKDEKLPNKLMKTLFNFIDDYNKDDDENIINKLFLHATNENAYNFYLKHGFIYKHHNNDEDNYYMYIKL